MLKFKEFILEYLTPSQEKTWSKYKMKPYAREDTDHFFGKDNDHVKEDIKNYDHDKSEIHKKIETHLGKELSHEEYKSGLTNDKYGRQVKLGKMIKDEKLKTEYSNDSTRVGNKVKQPYMTIVRGHHIAGQTNPEPDALHPTGHAWKDESCKNVESGKMKEVIPSEIEHGTVVVRGHDHDGKEIYRATLQPHHHENEDLSEKPVYELNSEYGIKHPSFTAHAHDVAHRLSGEYRPGVFYIHPDVYNDKLKEMTVHPGITDEHIHHAIETKQNSVLSALIDHPKITSQHLSKMLSPKSTIPKYIIAHFVKHPNMSEDNLTTALKNDDDGVRSNVMFNKNITRKHTELGLRDRSKYVRTSAFNVNNKHITPKDITKGIKDPYTVVGEAALQHPNATPEHISNGLLSHEPRLREAAIRNQNSTPEHISKALNDDYEHVRGQAACHPNATPEHISKALNDREYIVRSAAASNPNATSEHIYKALNDKSADVQSCAMWNPNVKKEHLEHAAKHSIFGGIRDEAEDRLDNMQ